MIRQVTRARDPRPATHAFGASAQSAASASQNTDALPTGSPNWNTSARLHRGDVVHPDRLQLVEPGAALSQLANLVAASMRSPAASSGPTGSPGPSAAAIRADSTKSLAATTLPRGTSSTAGLEAGCSSTGLSPPTADGRGSLVAVAEPGSAAAVERRWIESKCTVAPTARASSWESATKRGSRRDLAAPGAPRHWQ